MDTSTLPAHDCHGSADNHSHPSGNMYNYVRDVRGGVAIQHDAMTSGGSRAKICR
ncbi:hypothetical protein ACPOL_2800 [Acidisarcina polymorpha]|uniref:Uncharacterized protein n=1 Tax=Acidisarcina polymorpha TaxID=2211140 RepID=A0A2Z5FZ40_9BACT|nr:hypothetical protein ACPOL_2800 [Acidisarcina polymorpha]